MASFVLAGGALTVVLSAVVYRVFDLDRFFVPKEIALHTTAALAGLLALRPLLRMRWTLPNLALLAFLLTTVASAAVATNQWLAIRATAVSLSGALIFWTAQALRDAGLGRRLLGIVAAAVVLAAITSLAQAYGLRLDVFSLNRAPGGTLGNRNFIGHAAAFGLPAVLYFVLRARSAAGVLAGSAGAAILAATLVLTRSRAAWIGAAAVVAIVLGGVAAAPLLRRAPRTWKRLASAVFLVTAAVAAAILLPNTLRWRSDSPYLETARNVAAFDEGSGRGRLIQYERSLQMTLAHRLLGVGPGNWPVRYPEFAVRNDPSMDPSAPGMTYNPWPSSDWIAFVAERGPVTASLLAAVMIALAFSGVRNIFSPAGADEAMAAVTLVATVSAGVLTGLFDAVLLLPVPALLVWCGLGALSSDSGAAARRSLLTGLLMLTLIAGAAAGAFRSASQLGAMHLFATRGDRASLQRAAVLDPGNYRIRLRLARTGKRDDRCAHALELRALYPNSQAATNAARGCR
jgi:O-antigen ligase